MPKLTKNKSVAIHRVKLDSQLDDWVQSWLGSGLYRRSYGELMTQVIRSLDGEMEPYQLQKPANKIFSISLVSPEDADRLHAYVKQSGLKLSTVVRNGLYKLMQTDKSNP